jgi:hypothetical protein
VDFWCWITEGTVVNGGGMRHERSSQLKGKGRGLRLLSMRLKEDESGKRLSEGSEG